MTVRVTCYLMSLVVHSLDGAEIVFYSAAHNEERGFRAALTEGVQKRRRVHTRAVVKGYRQQLRVLIVRARGQGEKRQRKCDAQDRRRNFCCFLHNKVPPLFVFLRPVKAIHYSVIILRTPLIRLRTIIISRTRRSLRIRYNIQSVVYTISVCLVHYKFTLNYC